MFENKYRCSAVEMRDYQFQFYFISPFFFLNISATRWTQKVSINTLFKSKLSKSKQVIQIETIFDEEYSKHSFITKTPAMGVDTKTDSKVPLLGLATAL
jgi:hypothetical protein